MAAPPKPQPAILKRPSDAAVDDYVAKAGDTGGTAPPRRTRTVPAPERGKPRKPRKRGKPGPERWSAEPETGGRQVLKSGAEVRRMTIRVPYELGTEFINQADREGRDVSAVAAESFNMYLDDKQKWRAADRKVRRRASGGEAS